MYLDGSLVATLSGTPVPLSMTYDLLGTGYTVGHPATNGGYFPFAGTIDKVQIYTNSALAGAFSFPGTSNAQATFTPPATGTYTLGVLASNPDGGVRAEPRHLTWFQSW